jgi:aldehyde dehydrogenase (NAD+)
VTPSGVKASGIGRFGGQWAIEEFTTDHWVSVQREPRSFPIPFLPRN